MWLNLYSPLSITFTLKSGHLYYYFYKLIFLCGGHQEALGKLMCSSDSWQIKQKIRRLKEAGFSTLTGQPPTLSEAEKVAYRNKQVSNLEELSCTGLQQSALHWWSLTAFTAQEASAPTFVFKVTEQYKWDELPIKLEAILTAALWNVISKSNTSLAGKTCWYPLPFLKSQLFKSWKIQFGGITQFLKALPKCFSAKKNTYRNCTCAQDFIVPETLQCWKQC